MRAARREEKFEHTQRQVAAISVLVKMLLTVAIRTYHSCQQAFGCAPDANR